MFFCAETITSYNKIVFKKCSVNQIEQHFNAFVD